MWSTILLNVASSGRSFHICRLATGKARLQTVISLLVGTTRRLVPTERSNRRLGRSATRVKEPRYPGASPWTTLYVKTAILNSIPLRDMQPMKAGQHIGDVVGSPQVTGRPITRQRRMLTDLLPSSSVPSPCRDGLMSGVSQRRLTPQTQNTNQKLSLFHHEPSRFSGINICISLLEY